ncbi:TetR/AcrR family transcriptional regulator [Metarhizobium album]|uniref:TetR/AcrR family transcriptional regulator n=1 Tax=Metarhizobium album TaxID=2182425 RepID=A0A2U2DVK0_9HYPH|nr:TetR/AcrR family transcriptional regulator [Rhizobium album]PWE57353.1 TetR/AcrR family transcriptional regulator [Rhizobium album]
MKESKRKAVSPEQRKREILDAAFAVFTERGFAATRIEDIAARAGIAKGTVYLHFADKEALFTGLVAGLASPVLAEIGAVAIRDGLTGRQAVTLLYDTFVRLVLRTERRHLIRLIISEGPAFPAIAEIYHRDVISVGLKALQQVLSRAAERGELRAPAVAAVPQIVASPLILSIVWGSLFERLEPLDTKKLFDAFLDTLFMPPGDA